MKLKKIKLGVLIGTLVFNSLTPAVYAMSNSNMQSQVYLKNKEDIIIISD